MRSTRPITTIAAVAATITLVLAAPLSASAHVRITPKQAVAGADDTLMTFTVPNESAKAVTTKVVIDLPTATPFGDVSYEPVAGWTGRLVTSTLPKPATVDGSRVTEAPTQVIWTADQGTSLSAGEFQDFVITVGPMPDTGQLRFPTTQTYSDGSVVAWNEATPASGDEPEHPAPTLYINDPAPVEDRMTSDAVGLSAEPDATWSTAVIAIVLGATGVVLALIAIALTVGFRLRRTGGS